MEKKKVKYLLQRYFEGISTDNEEKVLKAYFKSDEAAEELSGYADFFRGLSEISEADHNISMEKQIMDYIRENENFEKNKYRQVYTFITGIAASLILIIGGMLLYQHQKEPFKDTFNNSDAAYVCAEKTLSYVSSKYNKGLVCLTNFDRLQTATEPLHKGVKPVNEFFEEIEKVTDNE
jgi:hypothetical protein